MLVLCCGKGSYLRTSTPLPSVSEGSTSHLRMLKSTTPHLRSICTASQSLVCFFQLSKDGEVELGQLHGCAAVKIVHERKTFPLLFQHEVALNAEALRNDAANCTAVLPPPSNNFVHVLRTTQRLCAPDVDTLCVKRRQFGKSCFRLQNGRISYMPSVSVRSRGQKYPSPVTVITTSDVSRSPPSRNLTSPSFEIWTSILDFFKDRLFSVQRTRPFKVLTSGHRRLKVDL